jgi:DNA end-binding protein Ku
MEFVDLDEIDPMFFDKPYFLEPQKKGAKAYALLREALRRSGKVGIAKVVIKTRQHLAAVKPVQNALVLELMHFAEELVKPDSLQIPGDVDIGAKELNMALELTDRMTGEWDPAKYTDDYRHALLELIEKKIELGDKALPAGKPSKKAATNVVDLASVLQESLEHATKGGAAKKRAAKQKRHLRKAA